MRFSRKYYVEFATRPGGVEGERNGESKLVGISQPVYDVPSRRGRKLINATEKNKEEKCVMQVEEAAALYSRGLQNWHCLENLITKTRV